MDHIQYIVPDKRSRVGYLLENVSGDFPNIMSAMASIILDNTDTGMRNDFDKVVSYLLPIAEENKKVPNKNANGIISKVISNVSDAKDDKA